MRGRPGRLGLGAGLNSQFTLKSNDGRRLDHPISRIWPGAAGAVVTPLAPIPAAILAVAVTGAAEHFPAVAADVGGSLGAMAMKPDATVMAHSLESAVNSSRL